MSISAPSSPSVVDAGLHATERAPGVVEALEAVRAALEAYLAAPDAPDTPTTLHTALQELAGVLISASDGVVNEAEEQRLRELLQKVSSSGIHDWPVVAEDLAVANQWSRYGRRGLFVAMLLVPAWQWPDAPSLAKIPESLVSDYVAWFLAPPQAFASLGDASLYPRRYLGRLEDMLQFVLAKAGTPVARVALVTYLQRNNCIPLYFCSESLKRHYEVRARLLSCAVTRPNVEMPPKSRAGRRLRVGIINRHFAPQTETYTTLPTFEQLDPERFEVMLFANQTSGTPLEDYARTHAASVTQLPADAGAQVDLLRAANLDVAVFGTNVTAVFHEITRLALHRVAPLQVVNNSSCTTTGMPEIDLYVSGTLTEAEEAPAHFSERLGLVAGPAHAFNYEADRQEPTSAWTRELLGLPQDAVVFVTAANFFKVIPEMQHAWAKLLAAVPGSRLLLHPFNPNWSSAYPVKRFSAELDRVLEAHGVATDRVVISSIKFPSRTDVKELLRVGDLYLDTYPFGGVNSLVDPLELGIPPIVWEGETFRARMGGALLRSLGLDELIATDEASYLALATKLATDNEARAALKKRIEDGMSRAPAFLDPVAASEAFGALLETAYDELVTTGRAAFRANRTPIRVPVPADPMARLHAGVACLEAGDVAGAESAACEVLGAIPDMPAARQLIAACLLRRGAAVRAVDYYLGAVQRVDGDAPLWLDLAFALRESGRVEQALQALETSLRLDSKNVDAWQMLAELADALGNQNLAADARRCMQNLTAVDAKAGEGAEVASQPESPEAVAAQGPAEPTPQTVERELIAYQGDTPLLVAPLMHREVIRSRPESFVYDAVAARIARDQSSIDAFISKVRPFCYHPNLDRLGSKPGIPGEPYWGDRWFDNGDARAAYGIVAALRPRRIIEIGSGNSTMFLKKAIRDFKLDTKLTSIDPAPRAEIDTLCDEVIRRSVLEVDLSIFSTLQPGDILFHDGSHLTFNGTDTVRLFLEILPRLAAGVIVHIHDICLPNEYISAFDKRGYSEQYMLAAALLYSDEFEILLPVMHASGRKVFDSGVSFWFQKRPRVRPSATGYAVAGGAGGAVRSQPPSTARSKPNAVSTKHVLLYTDDPQHGGVAQYNHSILMALVRGGYRVTCVQSESSSPLIAEQRAAGVQHRWVGYDTGREFGRTVDDVAGARRIFESEQPDLIVFSDCCPVSNLAARQAALEAGIPYVVVVGFVGEYLANSFAAQLPRLASQYAKAKEVVAVSGQNLDLLRGMFGLSGTSGRVIHYGRPAVFFAPRDPAIRAKRRAELGLSEEAIVCLTAARLAEVKGFDLQLAAIERLRPRLAAARLHFVWIGDGDQRVAIERAIAQRDLAGHVHLLGQRWDVAEWYDAADIFVLPSRMEGMPLAIMEAMAKGLPVIATGVSGIPEQLGETGKLLPSPLTAAAEVVQQLADTLLTWALDEAQRTKVGAAARRRAEAMFREETMNERTLAVLAEQLRVDRAQVASQSPQGLITFETRDEMLAWLPKGGRWLECGVFRGEFSEKILRLGQPEQLLLVDLWQGVVFSGDVDGNHGAAEQGEALHRRVQMRYGSDPRVSIHRGYSNVVLASLADDSLDTIYVDADHSYEGCKRDLLLAQRKVRPGGWICGHDYMINGDKAKTIYPLGVRRAVDEFCREFGYHIAALAMDGYVSYAIRKPAAV